MARILIVDDQLSLVTPLGDALRAAGHDVATAETLEDAVALEVENSFEVFLVDLVLTLAGLPPELQSVMSEFGSFPTNGGQAFVRWAHERNAKAKHLYITSSYSMYQQAAEYDRAPASERVLVRTSEEASAEGIVATVQRRFGI